MALGTSQHQNLPSLASVCPTAVVMRLIRGWEIEIFGHGRFSGVNLDSEFHAPWRKAPSRRQQEPPQGGELQSTTKYIFILI